MGACCSSPPARGTARDQLMTAPDNAQRYEHRSGTIPARVVDIYDGDTFTALIVHEGSVYRRRCRCMGYDAPEMRGTHAADKARAIAARDYLKTIVPRGVFALTFKGTDKYGRLLVTFDIRGEALRDHMIRMNHGYAYAGGTKRAADARS